LTRFLSWKMNGRQEKKKFYPNKWSTFILRETPLLPPIPIEQSGRFDGPYWLCSVRWRSRWQKDDARDDKKTITEDGIVNGRANQYWIFIAFSSKLHHVLLTRFSRELKSFLVKKEPRGMGKRGSWWSRFHFMVADSFGVLMMLLLLLILPRSLLIKRASCESVFLWEDPTGFRS